MLGCKTDMFVHIILTVFLFVKYDLVLVNNMNYNAGLYICHCTALL